MLSKLIARGKFILFISILFATQAKAQLADFTLLLSKTDENCPGNGSLSFNAINTAPGATVNYKIYKLPDTSTAIAELSINFLGGLTNGNYRVVATQSTIAGSSSKSNEIAIADDKIPFIFELESTPVICGNDAKITVNTLSGTAVSYEITSGPILYPIQTSNQFSSLPEGIYRIRAYDSCGEAFVQTRTIQREEINFEISGTLYGDVEFLPCDSTKISHSINADHLVYPINYTFTTHPPGGSSINYDGTILSGNEISQNFTVLAQDYTYTLKITDGCGNVYTTSGEIKKNIMKNLIGSSAVSCTNHTLLINPSNFTPPYTVSFTNAPLGFNPSAHNSLHPGPFTSDLTEYLLVPPGEYEIKITDGCGRTDTATHRVAATPVTPIIRIATAAGCSTIGDIRIIIPSRQVILASITAAPDGVLTLPFPANHLIEAGEFIFRNTPNGTYIVSITDSCGAIYSVEAIVKPNALSFFLIGKDCELGKGTLTIEARNTTLEFAEIISAPPGFPHPLPYDVSFNIGASFTMAGLIPGNYSIKIKNSCGAETIYNPVISGHEITRNDYEITPHCGSFDLKFNHTSNATALFWLQRLNPVTGTWGHPETLTEFTEGNLPTGISALPITNNFINLNLAYIGTFRIIKSFISAENGIVANSKNCVVAISQFDFIGHPEIVNVKSLTCNGVTSEVEIEVEGGVAPYIYEIIKKEGIDFFVNNGNSNFFNNLTPNIYTFKVTDACGEFRLRNFDVAALPPLVTANNAEISLCDDDSEDAVETFPLVSANQIVLGLSQSLSDYQIKYYVSRIDAIAQQNALPDNYDSTSRTIWARVDNLNGVNCFAISQVELKVLKYPKTLLSSQISMCDSNPVTVSAPNNFDSYLWSNSETNSSATFYAPGNYSLKVTKIYGSLLCEGIHNFEIINSNTANIKEIIITDWTANENTIKVIMSNAGDYEYSIDNLNFQDENIFYGLKIGEYTVYARNKSGCGPGDFKETYLLNYPKFFTPNGDGTNDFWKVKLATLEPNMTTFIFDRYGKLITSFGTKSPGWDGTFNGKHLPSTDYWFVIKRENGKIHKGHFSMKR